MNTLESNHAFGGGDIAVIVATPGFSSILLNFLRSLALGGYGNLDKVNKWNEESYKKICELVAVSIHELLMNTDYAKRHLKEGEG